MVGDAANDPYNWLEIRNGELERQTRDYINLVGQATQANINGKYVLYDALMLSAQEMIPPENWNFNEKHEVTGIGSMMGGNATPEDIYTYGNLPADANKRRVAKAPIKPIDPTIKAPIKPTMELPKVASDNYLSNILSPPKTTQTNYPTGKEEPARPTMYLNPVDDKYHNVGEEPTKNPLSLIGTITKKVGKKSTTYNKWWNPITKKTQLEVK